MIEPRRQKVAEEVKELCRRESPPAWIVRGWIDSAKQGIPHFVGHKDGPANLSEIPPSAVPCSLKAAGDEVNINGLAESESGGVGGETRGKLIAVPFEVAASLRVFTAWANETGFNCITFVDPQFEQFSGVLRMIHSGSVSELETCKDQALANADGESEAGR